MSWGAQNTPIKVSQLKLDLFEAWKKQQNEAISSRGMSKDASEEDEHNRVMLRHNLNGYTCYHEVDEYTACLQKNKLLDEEDQKYEINTKNKSNERLCRATHGAYVKCMSSQKNQEAIMQSAALHPACGPRRSDLLLCFERTKDKEMTTAQKLGSPMSDAESATLHEGMGACQQLYRGLLRCGLNHLWNDYWRAITKFSEADEYHLYELSRDDNKKQEYLRMVTLSEEQHQEYRRSQREPEVGYRIKEENTQ